ncbi:hypothetical protein [Mesorhizobium sp.]|uniref:hypothetical protein n=1 Tax=Mesorhizobium sp. TaxID=1871066 RepID=UPI0025C58943|nr:hypothetical protein [Mesorhizobium sp.]
MDGLLAVDRRCVDHEVGPVLPVLAAPDELRVAELELARLGKLAHLLLGDTDAGTVPDDLRVEIRIAVASLAIRQRTRARDRHLALDIAKNLLLLLEQRRHLGRGHIDAGVVMRKCRDGLLDRGLGHPVSLKK